MLWRQRQSQQQPDPDVERRHPRCFAALPAALDAEQQHHGRWPKGETGVLDDH